MKVAGTLVVAENMSGAKMFEVVRVGNQRLVGEIIRLEGERFFPQAMLGGFSFRAGVHTALEVRKIGRNTQNLTIVLKTCSIRLQKRARVDF